MGNGVWFVFTQSKQLISSFLSSFVSMSASAVYYLLALWSMLQRSTRAWSTVCSALPSRAVLPFRLCVVCGTSHSFVFPSCLLSCPFSFMLCVSFFHPVTLPVALLPDSSLSAFVFHDPSLYTVLSRLQLRLSPVCVSPSSLQRNPTRTVWLFVSCLFVQ